MKWICGAALAVGFSASAAFGQGAQCGPGAELEAVLSDRYGESIAGTGINGGGQSRTALYVNAETGTWTIVSIFPDGTACLRAAGDSWQRHAYPPQGEDG